MSEPACFVGNAEIGDVLAEIAANADRWDAVTARQDHPGSPHTNTKAIFLRWASAWTMDAIFDRPDAYDYPDAELFPCCMDLAQCVAEAVGSVELGRVMLVSLRPGGVVTPHWDSGDYAHHFDRFHVALQSDHMASLTVDNVVIRAFPGELWWFNHQLTHSAENLGDAPRLHLIVDCVAPEWRKRRVSA